VNPVSTGEAVDIETNVQFSDCVESAASYFFNVLFFTKGLQNISLEKIPEESKN